MQSDKPLEEIKANGKFSKEVNTYNKLLKEKQLENAGKPPTWFQTEWLFAECYTYFKLHEIFYIRYVIIEIFLPIIKAFAYV